MNNLSIQQKRQQRGIFTMAALFLVFTVVFYLKSDKTEDITFGFIFGDEWKLINEWKVASKSGVIIFLLIALIGIGISYLQFRRKKNLSLGSLVFGIGSIMAFLCWSAAGPQYGFDLFAGTDQHRRAHGPSGGGCQRLCLLRLAQGRDRRGHPRY